MKPNLLALNLLCATFHLARQQRQDYANVHLAAKGMGLQDWEFRRACQFLLGEGLLERVAGDTNLMKLTSFGLAEAKRHTGIKAPHPVHLFYLGDVQESRLPNVS